jgi:hypothetical protein
MTSQEFKEQPQFEKELLVTRVYAMLPIHFDSREGGPMSYSAIIRVYELLNTHGTSGVSVQHLWDMFDKVVSDHRENQGHL